ncbi:MAG: hypothetical protein CHACPFDD_03917 [Phycisphaerae bacterium]|nr:hypothetical protein [Phycisphaerae bacterium]
MTLALLTTLLLAVQVGGQAKQPTSRPATTSTAPASGPSLRRPAQVDILRQLLRDREDRRAILPKSDQPAATQGAGRLILEGTMIGERTGRIVKEGSRSVVEIDAVEGESEPRRFVLLENELLELAEAEMDRGVTRFRISGQVTRYRGRNGLLLIKVSSLLDHGNIKP